MANIELIKKLREMTGAGIVDSKKALESSNDDIDLAIEWLRKNGIAKASKKSDRVASEGLVLASKNENKIAIIEINSETDFVASNQDFKEAVSKILEVSISNDVKTQDDLLNLKIDNETVSELVTSLIAKIGEKISIRRFVSFDLTNIKGNFYNHSNGKISSIVITNNTSDDENLLRDIAMHISALNPKFASIEDIPEDFLEKEKEVIKSQYEEKYANKPEKVLNNIVEGALKKQLSEITLMEQDFVKDPSKKIKDLFPNSKLRFMRYEVGEGIEKKEVDFAKEVMEQVNKK